MPHNTTDGQFETAPGTNQRHIVESEAVQEKLHSYEFRHHNVEEISLEPASVAASEVATETAYPPIQAVVAIDGSCQEVVVNEEFPSDEVGYIQIADVQFDLERMLDQADRRFVDPDIVSQVTEAVQRPFVFPGGSIRVPDTDTLADSWRAELYKLFAEESLQGVPLLSYYLTLAKRSDERFEDGSICVSSCPDDACDRRDVTVDPHDGAACPGCGTWVYPTDALRIHETITERQSNREALSQVMSVLEHLLFAGYLLYCRREAPERLQQMAFVYDGSLALYQQPAWLHGPIRELLAEVINDQLDDGLLPPVILGVEKSGFFVEHADHIREKLSPQTLVCPDDEYIYDYIVPWDASDYGSTTHYGRPFIYKTDTERMVVFSVPLVQDETKSIADPTAYPCFDRALTTIETMVTNLYKDALLPATIAHRYASLPLGMGSQVLKLFSRKELRR